MSLTPTEEAQTRQLIAQEAPLLTLAASEATIISKLGATKVNLSQLPAATIVADADLLLIRQGTTDRGVPASAIKTYATSAASETVAGIVRLATDADVAAATSRLIAVDPAGLAVSSQKSATITAVATGTADALVATFIPAIATVANQTILVRATAANATTTPTINPGPGVITITKGANLPLAIGDISGAGHWLEITLDATLTKANLQNPATGVLGGQGVVGTIRNGKMLVTTASASATFTADEIVVETVLGGLSYRLGSFSQAINLATTGAGGMDTGTAPVSGYVALYAIYNPLTATKNILAVNATSAAAPNIYGGANMPAGYTASALISVVPTNSSGQIVVLVQKDREIRIGSIQVLNTTSQSAVFIALSIASTVPMNASSVTGYTTYQSSSQANILLYVASTSNGAGTYPSSTNPPGGSQQIGFFTNLLIATIQTIYYEATTSAGTPSFNIYIIGYSF